MNIFSKVWDWLFDPNFGFGSPAYEMTNHPNKENNHSHPPIGPYKTHTHSWYHFSVIRHNWYIKNGNPIGKEKYPIDNVIAAIKENASHTETKLAVVEGWRTIGYKFCHVSWNVYKCRICGETKNIEFYTAPIKEDGKGPFIYDTGGITAYNGGFKETTKMSVMTGRIEFAIEPMKKYR
jgi:hypothetical protein